MVLSEKRASIRSGLRYDVLVSGRICREITILNYTYLQEEEDFNQ